jgi:alkanesulfonate monooxygenase SsuD/methylene tetrahydromethanopterin reductase-like flavin-dependent oxidoreductase (luciferase family)
MKEIWTNDEAEFHGEFVDFEKIWSYPKPVQKPHPPIIMGGDGATTFDRVIEFSDGWMPIGSRSSGGPSLQEKIATLKQRAEDAGRDPSSISVTIFGGRPDEDEINHLESIGVGRVVLSLPSEEADTVTPLIDDYAKLIGG